MDLRTRCLDRRTVVTAACGLGAGMATVGGFAAADAVVRTPSLTIIGAEAAQFSLLRGPGVKIGFLFGAPSGRILQAVAPLLGWTSAKLDVLAIAPGALTQSTSDWLANQSILRTLLILGPVAPNQLPAVRPGVQSLVLTAPVTTGLPADLAIDFLPAFATALGDGEEGNVDPLTVIRRGQVAIVIGDDPTALTRQAHRDPPQLIVMPAGDLRQVVTTVRPQAVAMNGSRNSASQVVPPDLGPPSGRLALLQTYLTDPAVIRIGAGELRLPTWTKVMTNAAER